MKMQPSTEVAQRVAVSCALLALGQLWLSLVDAYVPEPYLDEVFHIPQAQRFCEGRWTEWDDKITTPPGLYVLSIAVNYISRLSCSVRSLRLFNVLVIPNVAWYAVRSRRSLEVKEALARAEPVREHVFGPSAHALATGVNIALFPVLFFFSGLYYTDVVSTFVVLLAYERNMSRLLEGGGGREISWANAVQTFLLGITALTMRQTNIFWVVVYMGGLEVIRDIKELKPEAMETPVFTTLSDQVSFHVGRYAVGALHDPPLNECSPKDVVLCLVSVGVAAICNVKMVLLRSIWPHKLVLVAFVAFVYTNGGVVLGDKSNHVATLHLAQMLYIWPLFVFFSAPLFVIPVLKVSSNVLRRMKLAIPQSPVQAESKARHPGNREEPAKAQSKALKTFNHLASYHTLHTLLVFGAAMTVTVLIVRFNTLIHPFTLADNRHYMFYVFRYTILRAWWARYALAPAYPLCAWLCWTVLQGDRPSRANKAGVEGKEEGRDDAKEGDDENSSSCETPKTTARQLIHDDDSPITTAPPTSTVLILLLAATLSLVTAPLVEPRYFILPWVFWRLLIPAWPAAIATSSSSPPSPSPSSPLPAKTATTRSEPTIDSSTDGDTTTATTPQREDERRTKNTRSSLVHVFPGGSRFAAGICGLLAGVGDVRIPLETIWFLVINVATMYIFLTRPFYWTVPDGNGGTRVVEDGRVQRFMW